MKQRYFIAVRFVLCFVFFAVTQAGAAPPGNISLDIRNLAIREVLREIERISDYRFIYEPRKVDLEKKVSVIVTDQKVETVLNNLLAEENVSYRITSNNLILITPKTELHAPASRTQQEQEAIMVSGVVYDADGMPLADVTIFDINSGRIAITDTLGRYVLPVASPNTALSFNYIGYETQQHRVPETLRLDVVMRLTSYNLTDVVVVGYGSLDRRMITNAVSNITSAGFTAGANSPLMAIQGKIPGLSILSTSGADPNAGASLQLRGVNSVSGDQGPLVVIDGVPGANMELIAKEDIESISVLKDTSAAAIYGTRASGGVVLITTRRPQVGRVRVNFSTELQMEVLAKSPDVLSADEFRRHGRTEAGNIYDFGSSTDWYDAVTKNTPFSQRYALSASGGTEDLRVSASGHFRDAEGIAIRNDRQEVGGRLNSYFKFLNNRLELSATINYTNVKWRNTDNNMFEWAAGLNPTYPVYDDTSESGYYMILNQSYFKNPVAEVELRNNTNASGLMLANVSLKLNITDHWSAKVQAAYKHIKNKSETFTSRLHRESLENHYNGAASHSFSQSMDKMLDFTTTYGRGFGRHSVNAVLGYSFQQFDGDSSGSENKDFLVDGVGPWDMAAGTYLSEGRASITSYKSPTTRLIAFFGRGAYSYDDRYLATVTMRYEGSSKFYSNRWGLFPGVSAGWRISSEKFMRYARPVDELTVRVSYGITGNQGFDANTAYRMYSKDSWIYYKGQWITVYGLAHNQNRDMKWEIKKEFDAGVDFSFFGRRISGRLDYFSRKIENAIYDGIPVASPPAVYPLSIVNIGGITNRGFEMELTGRIVQTKDWSYETSLVGSFVGKSRLEEMPQDSRIELYDLPQGAGKAVQISGGQKIGHYFVYRFAGVRQGDGIPMIYDKNNKIIPYASGTDEDRVQTGSGLPKAMLSWNNTVLFRNWDLNLFFRSWLGQDIYNVTNMIHGVDSRASTGQNLLRSAYGRNAAITNTDQLLLLDYWMENGGFLKLDAVTFGYTLPRDTVRHIEKLRCFFTVRNVFTLTGYTGLDPEVNVHGLAPGFEGMDYYPRVRTFTLGIELGF